MDEVRLSLQIPREHPSYAGHFPGHPIVPGVVLVDLVLQAAAQSPQWAAAPEGQLEIPVCKFMHSVAPGALLGLTLESGMKPDTLNFLLRQGEQLVASGSLRRLKQE